MVIFALIIINIILYIYNIKISKLYVLNNSLMDPFPYAKVSNAVVYFINLQIKIILKKLEY